MFFKTWADIVLEARFRIWGKPGVQTCVLAGVCWERESSLGVIVLLSKNLEQEKKEQYK